MFAWLLFPSGLSRLMTKPTKWLCAQRRLRSAWSESLLGAHAHAISLVLSWGSSFEPSKHFPNISVFIFMFSISQQYMYSLLSCLVLVFTNNYYTCRHGLTEISLCACLGLKDLINHLQSSVRDLTAPMIQEPFILFMIAKNQTSVGRIRKVFGDNWNR